MTRACGRAETNAELRAGPKCVQGADKQCSRGQPPSLVIQADSVCQQERVAFFGLEQNCYLLSTLSLPRDLMPGPNSTVLFGSALDNCRCAGGFEE